MAHGSVDRTFSVGLTSLRRCGAAVLGLVLAAGAAAAAPSDLRLRAEDSAGGAWSGRSPVLAATVTVDAEGGIGVAADGGGAVGLTLRSLGPAGAALPAPVLAVHAAGPRVVLEREGLRHEVVNDASGVRQVLRLTSPVGWDGAAPLELELELDSGTVAVASGRTLRLATADAPGDALAELRVERVRAVSGATVPGRLEVGGGSVRLLLEPTPDQLPVTAEVLLAPPAWVVWGGQAGARTGWAVATAGDVNGDGYSDVVVGSPLWDGGQTDEGRVRVYHGSAAGLAATPAWSWEPNEAGAQVGFSVATAGDVNGDGYSDLIVGAPFADGAQTDQGKAYVFLGSASGLVAAPAVTLTYAEAGAHFGFSVSSAGDVNGDGYSDVIVGAPGWAGARTYHGSSGGLSSTHAWQYTGYAAMGHRVALAGDLNGDGYSDVLISAPDLSSSDDCGFLGTAPCQDGVVWAFVGSPAGITGNWFTAFYNSAEVPRPSTMWSSALCHHGTSLAPLGDLDGDGYADFGFGSPVECFDWQQVAWGDRVSWGHVRVLRGSATGAVYETELLGSSEDSPGHEGLGASLFTAGDVNGDGYADLVLGAHDPDTPESVGTMVVRLGSPEGYTTELVVDPGYPSTGWAVSLAGDVNGDGLSDLVGGAPYADGAGGANEGVAFVRYGRADTAAASDVASFAGGVARLELGYALAFVDGDHDGVDDLLISQPMSSVDRGISYLYAGRPGELPDSDAVMSYTSGGDPGRREGQALATGDVNGDGFDDIVQGAPGTAEGGELRIYCGRAGDLPDNHSCATLTGAVGDQLGTSVAVLGDVNGDGIVDLAAGAPGHRVAGVEVGAVYLWLGSRDGLSGPPDAVYLGNQQYADFGRVVARAGDVNRDGFADLAVAAPFFDNGGLANAGGVWVFHGRQASPPDTTADKQLLGGEAFALYGYGLAGAGDVNRDGYSDLLVGQPYRDAAGKDTGRAILYPGSASGLGAAAWWTDGAAVDEHLGWVVAGGGDVNGDGYSDFVVTSPDADTSFDGTIYEAAGRARLFLGGPAGPTQADMVFEGDNDGVRLGLSAALAGDLTGDGLADVVVGAPSAYQASGIVEARTFATGVSLRPRQSNDDASPIPYQGATAAADSFRVALGAHTLFGRGYERLQVEVKPLGTAFDGLGLAEGTTWGGSSVPSIFLTVDGLAEGTPYHWRARQAYQKAAFPLQPHGPWRTRPLGSWEEADLRTPPVDAPDLRVDIGTNAPQLNVGSEYFATITVANQSSGFTAEGVTLTFWGSFMGLADLNVTAGINGSCAQVASDWVCTFTEPIPTGASRAVFAWGDTQAPGEVTLYAVAAAANGDLDPGDNFDSRTVPVVVPAGLELTVNSTGDGGDATPGDTHCETATGNGVCTLRAAVQEANALAGPNTVTIAVAGTISLASALTVTDDVTVRSGLPGDATISGGDATHVLTVAGAGYPDVVLEDLHLTNGYGEDGGFVQLTQAGDATLRRCTFDGSFGDFGGAVSVPASATAGNLLVEGCTFEANEAETNGGGAISVIGWPGYQRGLVEIRGSTFDGNAAGQGGSNGGALAILNTMWDLLVSDSAFIGNSVSYGKGGAVWLASDSNPADRIQARFERVAFSGNFTSGSGTIRGGAIATANADLDVVNCTFAGNTASAGGAIAASGGSLALSQTTFKGNTAVSGGGGGVYGLDGVVVLAAATVFDGNPPGNCVGIPDLAGDHNLSSDVTCVFVGSSNLTSTPALLGSASGGPGGLAYFPPLPASPALDSAGTGLCFDAFGEAVGDDMLGAPRPADGTGDGVAGCDRGAVEVVGGGPIFADGFETASLVRWSGSAP